jgi:hypothetical protein
VNLENVHPKDALYALPGVGISVPPYASIPFRAFSGEVISSIDVDANGNRVRGDDDVNTNEFFTRFTTNEVNWVGSGPDGSNSINFEIQTVSDAPGLGCGKQLFEGAVPNGAQDCWLVILPRGTGDNGEAEIARSGLFWDSWQHHIAFKLDFRPVGVRCEIGAAEKQIAGSELMTQAIASWQPQLCQQENGAAFVIIAGSDEDAAFKASLTTSNPLALTSRPLAQTAADPNVYAPIGVSSAVIAFNIDRRLSTSVDDMPTEYRDREATPFSEIKLTPRLLAKLLTASYIQALPSGADLKHIGFTNVFDKGPNAYNLTNDPDFLQWNDPEWQYQDVNAQSVADALMPTGRSDIAWTIWSYIMADKDARDFLNGVPDEWGMRVNPWYSSNSSIIETGVGKEYPRDDYPKADPVERKSTVDQGVGGTGALNLVGARPYASDYETAAYYTLRGDGLIVGSWLGGTNPRWGREPRSLIGSRAVIALTTSGSAAKFATISASLLNDAGQFVAPTASSMAAAVAAMTVTENSSVVGLDFGSAASKSATNAYPLTMPVYAALNPLMDDAPLRAVYADFIRFAAQSGQTPGVELGQLPAGYAPIPPSWVTQAMNAASVIQAGIKPAAPVNLGSLFPGTYSQAPPVDSVQNATVDGSGDTAILVSRQTEADPTVGALAGIVPLSLLTGIASGCAVPLFTRARKRLSG